MYLSIGKYRKKRTLHNCSICSCAKSVFCVRRWCPPRYSYVFGSCILYFANRFLGVVFSNWEVVNPNWERGALSSHVENFSSHVGMSLLLFRKTQLLGGTYYNVVSIETLLLLSPNLLDLTYKGQEAVRAQASGECCG